MMKAPSYEIMHVNKNRCVSVRNVWDSCQGSELKNGMRWHNNRNTIRGTLGFGEYYCVCYRVGPLFYLFIYFFTSFYSFLVVFHIQIFKSENSNFGQSTYVSCYI